MQVFWEPHWPERACRYHGPCKDRSALCHSVQQTSMLYPVIMQHQ